jgi:exoribonuclease-2
MIDRGLQPDFSPEALAELESISGPAPDDSRTVRDLRGLLWASIDNDDSLDLDQLTVSEKLKDGSVKILVSIADVDALVKKGSAIDGHARQNTSTVYTAAQIFPMLPEKLSTDLTSLADRQERLAIVVEMIVDESGSVTSSDLYRATVLNQAKLAYASVAAWLEGRAQAPEALARVPGMDEQIRTQDAVAQKMCELRHERGSLALQTLEPKPVFDGEAIVDLKIEERNRARQLIEEFMIAANGATAHFLEDHGYPSIRRTVRSPERWRWIVDVANENGDTLPPQPDSRALQEFLAKRAKADPLRFPDLSLVIVKLMGAGEYVVERPGAPPVGHFGLAVRDYTHSTAPNRRFADLITQRLLKAAMNGMPEPYDTAELETLATRCTEKEDDANKVERQVRKSAAALLLERRIGEQFDALVTGAAEKGTWVRTVHPPVEGRLVHGYDGVKIGQKIRVKLVETDVERGHIDFVRTGHD